MGLDIVACSRIKFIREVRDDEELTFDDDSIWLGGDDFVERQDGLRHGLYDVEGDEFHFRAGSYSGYNNWRSELSLAALEVAPEVVWRDFENFRGKPFAELICFSDCEGFIGPKTSAKLLEDFKKLDVRKLGGPWDEYMCDRFEDWQLAFKLAADNGVVVFR